MGPDTGMPQLYFLLLHHLLKGAHDCLPSPSPVPLPKGKIYRFHRKALFIWVTKGA